MIGNPSGPAVILMADDDLEDIMIVRNALEDCRCNVDFRYVVNGYETMDYLMRRGQFSNSEISPRPSLILLDINMPNKDGMQTLREIKCIPEIRSIPVVVLTTSRDMDLLTRIYKLGGSSFISKPSLYDDMVKAMDRLCAYWFETASLPSEPQFQAPTQELRIEQCWDFQI
jgi:CheY-like chemotaxis protein